MHETALLTIVFPSIVVGIPITMFVSYIFVESTRNGARGDQLVRMPSEEAFQKQSVSKALIERTASLSCG